MARSIMQLMYGHALSCVLKLTAMPAPARPLEHGKWVRPGSGKGLPAVDREQRWGWWYADKGWPLFEASVACANPVLYGSRLEFGCGGGTEDDSARGGAQACRRRG